MSICAKTRGAPATRPRYAVTRPVPSAGWTHRFSGRGTLDAPRRADWEILTPPAPTAVLAQEGREQNPFCPPTPPPPGRRGRRSPRARSAARGEAADARLPCAAAPYACGQCQLDRALATARVGLAGRTRVANRPRPSSEWRYAAARLMSSSRDDPSARARRSRLSQPKPSQLRVSVSRTLPSREQGGCPRQQQMGHPARSNKTSPPPGRRVAVLLHGRETAPYA
jgi:hypothetical protein